MPSNQFHRVEKLVGECEDWQDVTFENSWANAGGSYPDASYYKDPFNVVHIKGTINTGSSGTTAFTLPEGYRPPEQMLFLGVGAAAAAGNYITVNTSGAVAPTISGTGIHINGVSFRV